MEFCLYLDEQDVDAKNPYFCLAGIIMSREEYEKNLIPSLNALKKKYFSDTDIVFHYTDMKNNRGDFERLQDGEVREPFWNDFNNMIKNITFVTMGTYIDAKKYNNIFGRSGNKRYELAFRRLINNYILFLKKEKGIGNIVFESRTWDENKALQDVFQNIINYGTDMFCPEECKKYLSTIGFITKKDNCAGLQIADFVPNSFVRHINSQRNFHNVGVYFVNRIYNISGDYSDICGLLKVM